MREPFRILLTNGLRWNRAAIPPPFQVVAAMLGLAGPIALGAATGHLDLDAAASIGGLALSMGGEGPTWRKRALSMAWIASGGTIAMLMGSTIARVGGAAVFLVPMIAGGAGLLGSFNRSLAGLTSRFILFMIIAIGAANDGARPLTIAIAFLLGAVWTAGLSLGLQPLFEFLHGRRKCYASDGIAAPRRPTLSAQFRRWRRSLGQWSTWQYPVRISSCLIVAQAISWLLPTHHSYWVALTVTIVVRRQISELLEQVFERALGTICGVGLAMLLFLWSPPLPALIAMVAVLAALRTVLRTAAYTAYATIMTPLIMLLLDLGQTPSLSIMLDRLVATIIGCVLGLTLGYLVWPQVRAAASG